MALDGWLQRGGAGASAHVFGITRFQWTNAWWPCETGVLSQVDKFNKARKELSLIMSPDCLRIAKTMIAEQKSDFYVLTDDMLKFPYEKSVLPFGFPAFSRLEYARYHEQLRLLVKLEEERE